MLDQFYTKDQVTDELWRAYVKSPEYARYKSGIDAAHKLIVDQEKEGLRRIYINFVLNLLQGTSVKTTIKNRTQGDWLEEWKNMHRMLFQRILVTNGNWRNILVRFGAPGDEERHRIPQTHAVVSQISELAYNIHHVYLRDIKSYDEKIKVLAQVHYQFIRIHPFNDGNGRIARALTDQLAIYFDLPAAMSGYPKHDPKRRENYHHAIDSCAEDSHCENLALWIKGYIDTRIDDLA